MAEFRDGKGCSHQLVARGRGCMVSHCSCGNIHLNLGAVTLRLDRDELAELARTLGQAAEVVEVRSAPRERLLC